MINTALWTALITPMNKDGSIHFGDLKKLVRKQAKTGNGILLAGSTGEGLALTMAEKKLLVKSVIEQKPDTPIMVGVGGFQLANQVDWIQWCNKQDVDAFLMVNPLYAKPSEKGQVEWFKTLLEASEKPCMVYNIPSRTGSKISPDVIAELENHPEFWAVKEASGSIHDYRKFRESVPDVPLYSGDDALMPHFSVLGCQGLVSVASNVWPEATNLYVEKCLKGETSSLFPRWNKAIDSLFSAPNPIPVKWLMHANKQIENPTLRPPLTPDELSDHSAIKASNKDINNWYKSQKN